MTFINDELNREIDDLLIELGMGPLSVAPKLAKLRLHLEHGAQPDEIRVESLLKAFRGLRHFWPMIDFSDDFVDFLTPQAKVLQAQAHIEICGYGRAGRLLQCMLRHDSARIQSEANGLLGRLHKQRFVNALKEQNSDLAEHHVKLALRHYERSFADDPAWHGANILGLIWRANRENLSVDGDLTGWTGKVGAEIAKIDSAHKTSAWSESAKAQCFLANNDRENAKKIYSNYADLALKLDRKSASFTIGGDLRQLIEIWNLGSDDELLGSLTHRLISLSSEKTKRQIAQELLREMEIADFDATLILQAMVAENISVSGRGFRNLAKCQSGIVKIRNLHAAGVGGSGFLISGHSIGHETNEPVLVTNEHVLSETGEGETAIAQVNARIDFERLGTQDIQVRRIIWSGSTSPSRGKEPHDVTLSLLSDVPKSAEPLEICDNPGFRFPGSRRRRLGFVIPVGHPDMGQLSYSLGENEVVDHELSDDGPEPSRIRYVANTKHGSSGCPILTGGGQVVAVHEGYCPKREVNQGLAMSKVIKVVSEDLRREKRGN